MSKFNVGDRVRVTSHDVGVPFGEVFTVREVMPDTWRSSSVSREKRVKAERGDCWYRDDRTGHGVWENYLELVQVPR